VEDVDLDLQECGRALCDAGTGCGQRAAALLAYQTLINLYPTSDYAARARRRIESP
jgi:hypothetical protein